MKEKELILLDHGSGGKLSRLLIEKEVLPVFQNSYLLPLHDSALLNLPQKAIAFTTDSFVVKPLFFPGGDIGKLAVFGTCNDLAVMGAKPLFLSLGLILEEGFLLSDFRKILLSVKKAARQAGVSIITGDTKVVEKGSADGIFINSSGLGLLSAFRPRPLETGDQILISGTIGDHGAAILAAREQLFKTNRILSDCGNIYPLVKAALEGGFTLKFMRDPTRGGLATVLNELLKEEPTLSLLIREKEIPVKAQVLALCEITGISPFYLPSEGRVLMVAAKEDARALLSALRKLPGGKFAALIGEVNQSYPGKVVLQTKIGGKRFLEELSGEPLPRIC